jgi:glycosyltransferase involved in cell wall biosynthesis
MCKKEYPKTPIVSVVIPTYNREEVIGRALNSVLGQTFQDFEVLVCDDASTDTTVDRIKGYIEKDNRIKLFQLSSNQGPASARNLGMINSQGRYIAFLDSDDEWMPEKLERQVERMETEPPDVGVCLCGALIVKDGDTLHPVHYMPKKEWEIDTFRKIAMHKIKFPTPTLLFRRECIKKTGLMVTELTVNEDTNFLLKLSACSRLKTLQEKDVVIHLKVKGKKRYKYRKTSLPYLLNEKPFIREKCGIFVAKYNISIYWTALLALAIREEGWGEIFWSIKNRMKEIPILFPREVNTIARALYVRFFRKTKD